MNLSIGIVGLPNVGKSTLFNALLKRQAALAANYPFATIEPNVGVVDVPDERLQKLAELVKEEYGRQFGNKEIPEKIIPAVIKFYDIAGLVKGASQGEGLGNQFLSHIREVDAIIHLVRAFEDANVIRAGSISPEEDISTITTELILADLQALEKYVPKLETDLKKNKTPENIKKFELISGIKNTLNRGEVPDLYQGKTEHERIGTSKMLRDLNLLTLKPVIYVFNVSEDALSKDFNHDSLKYYKDGIVLCAKIESELSSFSADEKKEFMKELKITESGLDKVIRKGYDILCLQTFLTVGPKEVRAWTIRKGAKAPEAAGTIHTDFERGFISAEIISYSDLISANGWKNAKDKGLMRVEGKNYIMQDGDVVEFRFSV